MTRPNVETGTGTVVSLTNTYNTDGTLATSRDASGRTTSYEYDEQHDLVAVIPPTFLMGSSCEACRRWPIIPMATGASPTKLGQYVDPSTMKPPSNVTKEMFRAMTHVEFPGP